MKDAYYFSHDANAIHDPKIVKMMLDLKAEGYGVYWCIIEMLRNEPTFKLRVDNIDAIAFQSHSERNIVKKVIENYNLFKFSDDMEEFWSESLIRRMKKYQDVCNKARNSANLRWNNAKAMPTHCEGNALKERKGKEKKEDKVEYKEQFETFCSSYPKPVNVAIAYQVFKASINTDKDWEALTAALSNYKASDEVKKNFIKNADTWLMEWRGWVNYKRKLVYHAP